jgi:hypothetical protein
MSENKSYFVARTATNSNNNKIAQFDFENKMNQRDAIEQCNKFGNGWRLPTFIELQILYKNQKQTNMLSYEHYNEYWTDEEDFLVGFNDDGKKIKSNGHYHDAKVRIVRDLKK